MSLLSILIAPLVALVLQHAPAAPVMPQGQVKPPVAGQPAAKPAPAGPASAEPAQEGVLDKLQEQVEHVEESIEEHEPGEHAEHGKPSPSQIFQTLFKHLEPHAVAAVWFGGSKGVGFVKPYPVDAAGRPLHLEHDEPVGFQSGSELNRYYASGMGGGWGLLIYNINTVQWMAAAALLVVLLLVTRSARRQAGQAPRGNAYHVLESIVLYVRDDMVYPVMGKDVGDRFVPLFLTQFFFILFMNLFGLMNLGHYGGTATANWAVTAGLALTTLLFIHVSGIREHGFFHHWKNFIPHGLPVFLIPLIILVEIIGMLVKPIALTIRLAANLTAGHLVVLSFFGLIFLFGSYAIGVPVLGMSIAIYCLELFVCFVQAYIFTYLSIIFVGASVHPEH